MVLLPNDDDNDDDGRPASVLCIDINSLEEEEDGEEDERENVAPAVPPAPSSPWAVNKLFSTGFVTWYCWFRRLVVENASTTEGEGEEE